MQRPSQAEKERRQRWRERENNDAGSQLIKPQTGMLLDWTRVHGS